MRKALGRIALLLGVILVGVAGWWGAVTLFDEDDRADDDSSGIECDAAGRSDVRSAQRAFVKKYGDARWFGGAHVERTEEGFVLQVTYRSDRPPADLPDCQADVRVVAARRR